MSICNVCLKRRAIAVWVCIALGVSVAACRTKGAEGQEGTERICIGSPLSGQRLADLLEVEKVIPLETNENGLVGYVASSVVRPSGFYIMTNGQVVKFDGEGKFVYNINRRGRAPEEFLDLDAISVDRDDRFLYVYDGGGRKVIWYDAQSGEYVRHTQLDYKPLTFAVMPDGKHFVFYCGLPPGKSLEKEGRYPRFIIADSTGTVEKAFAYCGMKVTIPNMFSAKNVFAVGDSSFYCFANYNDTIFSIGKDLSVVPACVLDYGNGNQEKQDALIHRIEMFDRQEGALGLDDDKVAVLSRFCFTGKYWFFMSLQDDDYSSYLYDKETGRTVNLSKLEDDPEGFVGSLNACSDYFYTVLPAIGLKESRSELPFGAKFSEVAKQLCDDANPVVLVLRVKKI